LDVSSNIGFHSFARFGSGFSLTRFAALGSDAYGVAQILGLFRESTCNSNSGVGTVSS
jgi:hypothetical protein